MSTSTCFLFIVCQPGEQNPEDSLEYRSGDTESDIEEEPQSSPSKIKKTGKPLVQIKEKGSVRL